MTVPLCIIGIDPSLTSTGVATPDGTESWQPSRLAGVARLNYFYERTLELCRVWKPDIVVIEGYAFASNFAREALGELSGVVRLAIHRSAEIPPSIAIVTPKQRAKYATNNGNAGKAEVVNAANEVSGHLFPTSDEADAWWLRQMGLQAYAQDTPDLFKVSASQRSVVHKIVWPGDDDDDGPEAA